MRTTNSPPANPTSSNNRLAVADHGRGADGILESVRSAFTVAINRTTDNLMAAFDAVTSTGRTDTAPPTPARQLSASPHSQVFPDEPREMEDARTRRAGLLKPESEDPAGTIHASTTPHSGVQGRDVKTRIDRQTAGLGALKTRSVPVRWESLCQTVSGTWQSVQLHWADRRTPLAAGEIAGLPREVWKEFIHSAVPSDMRRPGGMFDALKSQRALACSSKGLAAIVREAGLTDPTLHFVTRALNQLVRKAAKADIKAIARALAGVQTFLSPENQKRLAAKPTVNTVTPSRLASITETERETLVDNVLDCPDEGSRPTYLRELGRDLAYLNEAQREHVVDAVLGIPNESARAHALTGLTDSLQHLEPAQRKQVVTAMIAITDESTRGNLLKRLGARLQHLEAEQHGQVVDAVVGLGNDHARAAALAGLGAGLKHLDKALRSCVVDATTGFVGQHWCKSTALQGLRDGFEYLDDEQQGRVVETVTALSGESLGTALVGLSTGVGHLKPALSRRVALAVIGLPEGIEKADALAGMGPCLEHLEPDLRKRVVIAAVGLADGFLRARALAGLAAALAARIAARARKTQG